MKTRSHRVQLAAMVAAAAAGASPVVGAQDSAGTQESRELEQVVVTGRFLGEEARSAMKLDAPLLDTPFTVQSYTDDFLKSIETTNVSDLYNYMTGVKRAGNTGYDLTIRGFKTGADDLSAIMVDGLPGLTGRFGSPPTVGVDHIEVVKGPMSVLYGQIQPGGFVNLISKKPQPVQAATLDLKGTAYSGSELSMGDRTGYDTSGDITGPIDQAGKFLYRLIGQYGDRDLFRDYTFERNRYFAGGLTWNIGEATAATVQADYRRVDNSFDVGLAAPFRDIDRVAPITTRYQEPDDFREERGHSVSGSLTHSFTDGLTWNIAARSVRNQSDDGAYTSTAVRPSGLSVARRARRNHIEREYDYFDSNLQARFATGPFRHQLLVGVNGGRDTADEDRRQFFNSGPCPGALCFDIDLYNPVYGRVPPRSSLPAVNPATPQNLRHQHFQTDTLGVYVSDLITLSDHWKVTFGARSVEEEQEISELRLPNVPTEKKRAKDSLVPMAGVLFQPTSLWTVYASYAESYVPAAANENDINGLNPFTPVTGEQIEVGTKVENLLDGRLTGTLSLFQIDRDNVLDSFACALGTCSEQIGSERTKGVELEINAQLLDDWQIAVGYAYLDATVTESNDPVRVGSRLTNVAKNSANLWSRYDVTAGPLAGLGLGLGVVYTAERSGILPTTASPDEMRLPAYTVVDVAISYDFEPYTLNLKVGNVLDEVYYESAGFTGQIQIWPGAPRNVSLSLRRRF